MYSLVRPPAIAFQPRLVHGMSTEVPIFEPYEENLPLQSGYYSFVIDDLGRLRVKGGNTSSHAAMAGGSRAAAAGSFKMSRQGKLAEVYCRSTDYRFRYSGPNDRAACYVIDYFVEHPAFKLSDHAFFQFYSNYYESIYTDKFRTIIPGESIAERRRLIEIEDVSIGGPDTFEAERIRAYLDYQPSPPPRLYAPQIDQLTASLLEDSAYETGEGKPRYSPDLPRCSGAKYNFVCDSDGWLILGIAGHHILSGCRDVGAAGQLLFDELGLIREINLNFSGHYRPPLSGDYSTYTYITIRSHPLLELGEDCKVSGRIFDEISHLTTVLRFEPADLLSDGEELDLAIMAASVF